MRPRVDFVTFPGSYALLAEGKATTAAVFVHGFLGHAEETWLSFQDLMDAEAEWAQVDAYFFQYDSFGTSITKSAEDLQKFLDAIFTFSSDLFEIPGGGLGDVAPSLASRTHRIAPVAGGYVSLWLVGHSLGGLVLRALARDAVKSAIERKVDLSDPSKLPLLLKWRPRLFAPAISGARPARLLGLALELGGVGMVARVFLGRSPSFGEMRQGSELLDLMRDDTTTLAKEHAEVAVLRARVLWPERDDVVTDAEYLKDGKNEERPPGTRHASVCKPRPDYLAPLRFAARGTT